MSDDAMGRSDNLDARIEQAGGEGAVVSSLVKGLNRVRRMVFWLAVSLCLDIVLTTAVTVIFLRAQHTQDQVATNQKAITHNLEAQTRANWIVCNRGRINATQLNVKNAALIAFLKTISPQTPSLVKFTELSRSVLIVPVCGPKP